MQEKIETYRNRSISVGLVILVLVGLACNLPVAGSNTQTQEPESQALTVNPDGQTYTDENGIGIMIPAGALSAGSAQLSFQNLEGELAEELSQAYDLETPAYRITAQGMEDGVGKAILSFPASSPEMRLLAIIDGEYAAVLNITPENGVLSLPVDVHPADVSGLADMGAMWTSGNIQYAVVTPKPVAQSNTAAYPKLTAPARQQGPTPCFSLIRKRCWQTPSGWVFVMMNESVNLTPSVADAIINQIVTLMDNYERLGFDAAIISASNPVYIVVEPGQGTPLYRPANGVVYIPNDVATAVAGGKQDFFLAHELAHWIQDEEYFMTIAYAGEGTKWWIETSAENMAMLLDSAYVGQNLTAYGQIDVDDQTSALQASPYQWAVDEFYVQAQLVKVNMRPDAPFCPLSVETFVKAINYGSFPYEDLDARQKVSNNLEDYARYLLGVAPRYSNTAIPLDAVQSGEWYGDYVRITQTSKDVLDLEQRLGSGRMKPENQGGMPGLVIEAPIQKDGVYVLRVLSGMDGKFVGLPASLRIEVGTPVYYRSNNGEVQTHDGTSELVIQPIVSQANGISDVRIVAVGKQGGEVFKARLGLVDLSGVWVLKFPDYAGVPPISISCAGQSSFMNDSWTTAVVAMQYLIGLFSTDTSADGLTWKMNASQLNNLSDQLRALGGDPFSVNSNQMNGSAVINPGEIKMQSSLKIEEKPLSSIDGSSARQVQSFQAPGTYDLEATFTSLEYLGGIGTYTFPPKASDVPVWRLRGGQAVINVDVMEINYNFFQGVLESQSRNACQGTITSDLEVLIYKGVMP